MSSRSVRIWCAVVLLSGAAVFWMLLVIDAPWWLLVISAVGWIASCVIAGLAWHVAREVDRNNAVPRERVIPNGRTPL